MKITAAAVTGVGMFGHDNQNDQNQQNDTNTPVVDPTTSSAPFDTSAVSLGMSNDTPAEEPAPAPVLTHDEPAEEPTTVTSAPAADENHLLSGGGNDDLLALKQSALQQLSPLVDHLDQTPEEKFRTTMMMIQASDDQNLIQAAYNAAKEIPDEKVRAQALLDVINEINYFTQQPQQS